MEALAIALLALALLLFIAEAHAPTTVAGLLGVAALVGAGFAWRDAGHDVPVAAIVVAGVILAGFVVFASRKAIAAHRDEPVRTGSEELVGAVGEVREPLNPDGQIFIQGALWRARATSSGQIGPGNRVRVKAVDGLTLEVEPVADRDPATVEKGA
ncbi:MAG TPA: NfeD family protein [Solirubrobacterales bacterium]|jgi:membrane-bound serine protease (ClpP class)|nr:NfeD family protein [Solirubrobacterales bacterium]